MTNGAPGRDGGQVRPVTALVFATLGFVALAIFGLGITSLATSQDIIETPGLGQVPGIAGMVLTTLAFAGGLWAAIRGAGATDASAARADADARNDRPGVGRSAARPRHPSFWGAAWTTAACFLAYIGGVWFGVLASGAGLGVAAGVAGRLATSWFGLAIAAAAFVCAWSGIALVRTRAHRPRWPWEDEFDE
ncbi:hypothetical protein [Microbacterium cremeum]|uniref:hypothetical protein n=1 Tax=Microbacterium cremeum TaxID=2782169 RepID=UPI0018883E6E|nr:hypothetical protein [Microbacterium cremeum]